MSCSSKMSRSTARSRWARRRLQRRRRASARWPPGPGRARRDATARVFDLGHGHGCLARAPCSAWGDGCRLCSLCTVVSGEWCVPRVAIEKYIKGCLRYTHRHSERIEGTDARRTLTLHVTAHVEYACPRVDAQTQAATPHRQGKRARRIAGQGATSMHAHTTCDTRHPPTEPPTRTHAHMSMPICPLASRDILYLTHG